MDSLTYEQFMVLGDAELSRRFSMQDEVEQKEEVKKALAAGVSEKQRFLLTSIRRFLWRG